VPSILVLFCLAHAPILPCLSPVVRYRGGTTTIVRATPEKNLTTRDRLLEPMATDLMGQSIVGNGRQRLTLGSIPDGIELIEDPDDLSDDGTDGSDFSVLTGITGGASNTNVGSVVGGRRGPIFRRPASWSPGLRARPALALLALHQRRSALRRIPDGIAFVQMLEDLGDFDDDDSMGDLGGPLEPDLDNSTSELSETERRTNVAITTPTEEENYMPECQSLLNFSSLKSLASASSTRDRPLPIGPLPVHHDLFQDIPLFDNVMRAHLRALDLAGWYEWKKNVSGRSTASDPLPLGKMITALDALDIAGVPKLRQEGHGNVVDQSRYSTTIPGRLPSLLQTGVKAKPECSLGSLNTCSGPQDKTSNSVLGQEKERTMTDHVSLAQPAADASSFSSARSTDTSSSSAVTSANVSNSSSTCSNVTPLSDITSATKLEINRLKKRRTLQSRHEAGVAVSGLMYYLDQLSPGAGKGGACCKVATPRFKWRVERIKEASSTDGRIFASLLSALKGVLPSEARQESSLPIPNELATEFKDRSARKALADHHIANLDNSTVLHLAAAGVAPCCLDLCKLLVEDFGADLDIEDGLGRTARSIAIVNNNRSVIEWARAAGTPPERNRLRVLFAEPLVYVEKGEMKAIKKLNFELEKSLLIECVQKVGRLVDVLFEPATDRHLLDAVAARCGVLHISCHGVKIMDQCGNPDDCVLLFEDGSGGAHFLSVEQIQKMIEAHSEPVKFAFVSACHSEQIGRAFARAGVPHVVCCEQSSELMDGAAAEFMRSVYSMLIEGHTVKTSFSSAVPLVSGRMGSEEASKFLLLPESSCHEQPIFDAPKVESNEEQNIIAEHHLPTQPVNIDGCEIALYQIVSELLKEERGKHLVNIVGENNVHRSKILAAACHYIKDRLSTAIHIKKIFYIKCDATTTAESLHNSVHMSLTTQITSGKSVGQQHKDFGEADVVNALTKMKALVVLDEFDGFEDDLKDFLGSFFHSAKTVCVLLTTQKEVSDASDAGNWKKVFV